jgi:hypothetical protein
MSPPSLPISDLGVIQFLVVDFLIGSDTVWLSISESTVTQFLMLISKLVATL